MREAMNTDALCGAMKARAIELLGNGTVDRVAGWKRGEFAYDMTPAIYADAAEIEREFVYNEFCGANLSKYMVAESAKPGKILAFLKPCDTYSFNQLESEHKVTRGNVYIIGVECGGMVDVDRARAAGVAGIETAEKRGDEIVFGTIYGESVLPETEALAERCLCCKSRAHVVYDELIGEDGKILDSARFDMVEKLESMTPEQRFDFWRGELSRCVRCNACRNVCPACTCEKCIFDNPASGVDQKAAADSFEENMFHIIRAFHVAGRCTDCGECSRVCPEHIPLHLLNRKFIKDIDSLYGEYQAGAEVNERGPLVSYTKGDSEPSVITSGAAANKSVERGEKR